MHPGEPGPARSPVAAVKAEEYPVREFAHFDYSWTYPALSSAVLSDDLIKIRLRLRNGIGERIDRTASEERLTRFGCFYSVIQINQCDLMSSGQKSISNKACRFK